MPFTFIILLIIFIAAMVWLVNWEPEKKDEEEIGKKVRKDVEGVFKDLKDQAITHKRGEYVPALNAALKKVVEVFDKHKLGN